MELKGQISRSLLLKIEIFESSLVSSDDNFGFKDLYESWHRGSVGVNLVWIACTCGVKYQCHCYSSVAHWTYSSCTTNAYKGSSVA